MKNILNNGLNFKSCRCLAGACSRFLALMILLVMIGNGPVRAQGIEERRITIAFDNISIKEALRKIETAGSLVISYVDDDLASVSRVSGRYDNKTIAYVLTAILDKWDLDYSNAGTNVFIGRKEKPKKKGVLAGRIRDGKSGDPLIGAMAKVNLAGTQTDMEGNFRMELPPGKYNVEITYMGYRPVTRDDVQVNEGRETILDVTMNEDGNALNEVIVRDRKITGTSIAMIEEIRLSRAVVSGISKEQIARSQDRDAAEIIRRIPGVSVMQNRFIVVRGLPQRYNAVMLNNAVAPSFEADSRAFSFDIMPSSMIDRVMIYKTAVPELPGDFAGGVVKVYTTGMPAHNGLNVTYQASARPNTSFRNFYEQPQGNLAWLGYDDGTYSMPGNVPSPVGEDDRKAVTPLFNSNWDARERTAPVDHRLSLDFSRRINLARQVKLGVTGGFNYSNTYQYSVISRNVGQYDTAQKSYLAAYNFTDQVYAHTVRLNGLLNVTMDIGDRHRIDFKNLYTHTGDYEYTDRNGISGPLAGDGTGLMPGLFIRQMIMTNAFRDILTSQINGSHELFKDTKLSWLMAYTKSNYDDPDQRRRTQRADIYANDEGGLDWDERYESNAVSQIYWGRYYYKLPEETRTFGLDMEQHCSFLSFAPTIKAGLYLERKERSFELRQLGLLHDVISNEILIGEDFFPWNNYAATNALNAGYVAAEIPFLKSFKLYSGLRVEDNRQQMHTYTFLVNGVTGQKIDIDNHKLSYLPSANLSFDLTGKSLIRAAYSKTLNRPEFREIAPFYFYDLRTFSTAFGNPDIKPQADIHNYDLRYEWYPAAGEMFNAGIFYKEFFNPIEYFYYVSTSGINSYMWGNADRAVNYGAEVDMIISLARLTQGNSLAAKALERTTLLFNAAYIFSKVDMGAKTLAYQDKNRPLFGQSPYTVNAALSYTHDDIGLKLNLAYNIIGKRIIMVGNAVNPNVYELPRHSLDFSFSKALGKRFEVKGGIQNILNARFLQMQDSDGNGQFSIGGDDYAAWTDNRYLSWFGGTYYTVGLGLKL